MTDEEYKNNIKKEKTKDVSKLLDKIDQPVLNEKTINSVAHDNAVEDDMVGDISSRCKAYLGTAINTVDMLKNEISNSENYREEANDQDSYLHNILISIYSGIINHQFDFLNSSIGLIRKDQHELTKKISGLADRIGDGEIFEDSPVLSGEKAKQALIARMSGLMRVYLYNSGFWVDIKSLNLAELNEFYNSVDNNNEEYGRILGGYSYFTTDIYVKECFINLLPKMVVDSNLKNWRKGRTLIQNISFHDYDVLLWAASCLQFKTGTYIGTVCTNPKCKTINNENLIKLKHTRLNNFNLLDEKAIKLMRSDEPKTSKDLKTYRDEILDLSTEIEHKNFILTLGVPTVSEYLSVGLDLTSTLISSLRGESKMTTEEMTRVVSIYFYPMIAPWVKKITMLKRDGSKDFSFADKDNIYTFLAEYKRTKTKNVEDKFVEKISNFIKKTKISFFCSSPLKCPVCGNVIETDNDLFPLDFQQIFFAIACRQLELAGNI